MRPLYEIAREIDTVWSKVGKGVWFGARPYLDAMKSLTTVRDNYGLDSGTSIVLYFLANAATFRGEDARRLKAELKEHTK
jgi:hypothetical protein